MTRKTALALSLSSAVQGTIPVGEIVTVLAPGQTRLPQRRVRSGMTTVERFVAVLGSLVARETVVAELTFTKALEARSAATLRAMTCDLEGYALFASAVPGTGLPASAERLVQWIDHLECAGQRPSTIARKLATLATVHGLLGLTSATSSPLVRDTINGMRRRQGKPQRQAAGLRLGQAIGDAPVKGFTLAALLDACGTDLPGLRDAALLSLGYDAGLRVSELLSASVESLEVQDNGSGLLDIARSKTDQEGQGACAWVSPETMRRIAAWRDAASIRSGPLFRRVGVMRRKGQAARKALAIGDLAPNAQVDRERMAAIPARQASVTYAVGETALTVAAVWAIVRKRALAAADMGLVALMGQDLKSALAALSTHSLRVGLTQDLFADGADAGPIAQALRWSSVGTALRYGRRLAPASNAAARMLAGRRG